MGKAMKRVCRVMGRKERVWAYWWTVRVSSVKWIREREVVRRRVSRMGVSVWSEVGGLVVLVLVDEERSRVSVVDEVVEKGAVLGWSAA